MVLNFFCFIGCPDPPGDPDFGSLTIINSDQSSAPYSDQSTAVYSCDSGFAKDPSDGVLTCDVSTKSWVPDTMKCLGKTVMFL